MVRDVLNEISELYSIVTVNFEKKNLKVGNRYFIHNGELLYNPTHEREVETTEEVLANLDRMYKEYKYSMPSERSDRKRRNYFKALKFEELTDEQLFTALPRDYARAQLETYLLSSVIYGNLKWTEDMGSFFWQSKSDPDFIILRSWVEQTK